MGYTPRIGPYNTSYLRHVMLSYVIYIVVYIILYCNNDWCVKDGVVHRSRQQSLVAKWLGGGVTVRARAREWFFFFSVESDKDICVALLACYSTTFTK